MSAPDEPLQLVPPVTPADEPDQPVLLTRPTPWGVRLILNRPAKLNALSVALVGALAYSVVLGDIHRLEVDTD